MGDICDTMDINQTEISLENYLRKYFGMQMKVFVLITNGHLNHLLTVIK